MFKNQIITAFRNLKRHKIFSAINILGLAGSMAVFIMITIYVRLIAGTDKFHENAENIYRLERENIHNMAAPIGPHLTEKFSQIESFLRLDESPLTSNLFQYNEKTIKVDDVWYADSTFFTSLSFPLVSGSKGRVLSDPDAIVLSEKAARRIFGNENPIGKSLTYNNLYTLKVTGVMENIPSNSSIQADAILPFDFHKTLNNDPLILESFTRWNYNLLLTINQHADIEQLTKSVNKEVAELVLKNIDIPKGQEPELILTPLTDIYFNTYTNHDSFQHGSRSNITIAIGVSIIILLLAIINFTNLSTAQATYRAKEIGIRKTLGAGKSTIIRQHLVECIITAYISIFIAAILVEQFIHVFSSMVNIELTFNLLNAFNLTTITLGPIALGILAGSYPAFFVSSFSPKAILSGEQTGGKKGTAFRKALIAIQFVSAATLIIFTLHVNRQVNHLINKDLGINKENRLFIETSPEMLKNRDAFLNELWTNPNIINASMHASPLGIINEGWGMSYKDKNMNYRVQLADSNYISTLGAKIIQGRNFRAHEPSDSAYEVLINQRAVEKYNLENPIGITIPFMQNIKLRIVGIVNDFHYESLHKPIEPLMIVNRIFPNLITINYTHGKTQETIRSVEQLWEKFSPNSPLSYEILSDDLAKLYAEEARLKRLFQGFTIVAIFIACIGLFGLATYDIGKRIREIGIRKVLGSTSTEVVRLLVWDSLKMVVLSMLIAFPVSYWLISKWLQGFITPAGHSVWLYLGSGMLVMTIAILTVVYHSTKAANTNPANVLKYE
ncbi:MAG: ABC transporter permease [Perlabentimonas sp.]